jgi:predicted SnoaL-like aldol condensation-catalyzing enzyme
MGLKKDVAVSFLQLAASGRVREAFANHAGPGFRHHNPFVAAGADALLAAMEENARANPGKRFEVLRAIEDDDLVAVHSHVRQKPDDRGAVVVHLFRFEGDRIVELWDVGMAIPEKSVNGDGVM